MPVNEFDVTNVEAVAGVQAPATQLVESGQGTVLIYNTDPSNTVQLGDNNAIQAIDGDGIAPLPPLSSLAFDGTSDVFATIGAGLSAKVAAYPSAIQFNSQTLITPLAQLGTFTGAPAALNIAPGAVFTALNLADVSRFASYDLNAYAFAQSAGGVGAGLVCEIQIQWFDDMTSGIAVFEEDWWIWVGRALPTAGINTMCGCGPMHGRYMSVNVIPAAPGTTNITLQYMNIFGSNRTVPYSDWRQNGNAVDPESNNITLLATAGTSFDNVLAQVSNVVLGASQLVFVPCGLYSGPVYYRFQVNTAAALHDPTLVNMENHVSGDLVAGTGISGVLVNATADTLEHEGTLLLPRSPAAFIIQGAAAGTSSFSLEIIAQQAA